MSRLRRVRCTLAIILAVSVAPLAAQGAHGRVIDAATGAAIVGAAIEFRPAGEPAASPVTVVSSSAGGFRTMLPRAGRWQVRVMAIGYAPLRSREFEAGAASVALPDVALQRIAVVLPDLRADGGARRCRKGGLSDDTFGRLLESAHTSLQVIEATIRSGAVRFDIETIRSTTLYGNVKHQVTADTTVESALQWPVQSLDPDTLRRVGFSRPTPMGPVYYGPDPRVLFAGWFLEGHCFAVEPMRVGSDSLRIRFEPRSRGKLVDLSGTFTLDARTLALLNLTFRHRNLPRGLPDGSAGGELEFERLASGLWIARDWAIWGPVERPGPWGGVAGLVEVRGRVRDVTSR